jgi:hypothetical protein
MYPFLSKFFESRRPMQAEDAVAANATQTFTAMRESPDQDEPAPERKTDVFMATSTVTETREEADSDPSRDELGGAMAVARLGTETFTRTREDPDTDPAAPQNTGTQTMTKTSGEAADADAVAGPSLFEASLL